MDDREGDEKYGDILRIASADEAGRRAFAAYFLKMISGYVLYLDSEVPSQRRTANICKKWLFSRSTKHVMTFHSICEIFDLDPDIARDRIKCLQRDDLLRKAKTCYEEPTAETTNEQPDAE